MSHDEIGMAFHRHQMQLAHSEEIIEEMMREAFEERAGICEFDGQQTRPEAEALAKAEVETLRKAMEEGKK